MAFSTCSNVSRSSSKRDNRGIGQDFVKYQFLFLLPEDTDPVASPYELNTWPTAHALSCFFGGRGRGGFAEPLFLYILSALGLPFRFDGACRVAGFGLLLSFVPIRADSR